MTEGSSVSSKAVKAIRWFVLSGCFLSACSSSARLDGEWQGRVSLHEGDTVEVVMDLQKMGSRWVGSYDVAQFGMDDYPIEVIASRDSVKLFFSRPDAHFEGKLGPPGVLSGTLSHDTPIPLTFHRTGEAKFSEMFLKVEQAADDPTLVEVLTPDAAALRARFNADQGKTRLLMLLSPT